MNTLRYFRLEEFACKCCGRADMDEEFLRKLDDARALAGVPFKITSGYRCPKHNAAVGSTSTNHTQGKAADIAVAYGPVRLKVVHALLDVGFRRIGIGKDMVHCDVNNEIESIWLYL